MAMDTEHEPWQQYYEAFSARARRIPSDAFDRGSLLYEAAHDAYESTTNNLTAAGWDAERALTLGRLFGSVVKDWVQRGGQDEGVLKAELRAHYRSWTAA